MALQEYDFPGNARELENKLELTESGVLKGVRFIPSPNCDERPADTRVSLLVIHNISLPPTEFEGDAILQFFTNNLDYNAHPYYRALKGLKVSAHFLIRRNAEIIQFVACRMRAWHAGVSHWQGQECCNDFSIGVELEGSDVTSFSEMQYDALANLSRVLKQAYPIEKIVGHSDIAPDRKSDPGPFFNWEKYLSMI